jgi:hypothetical protein
MAEAYSSHGRTAFKYQYSALPATHASDIGGYFGPLGSVPYLSEEFQRAFMKIWGNFITNANQDSHHAIASGWSAGALEDSDRANKWPAFSIASPYQLNLNQTGGAPAVGGMDFYSPVNTTYFTNPGLKNLFTLDNAYKWEGDRGVRCDFWRSVAAIVPM